MNYNPDWIPFYEELANSLLRYKNNRKPLIGALKAMEGMPNLSEKSGEFLKDICPFTVFSTFNRMGRTIAKEKRIEIAKQLANFLNVKPPLLESLAGIPTTRYNHFPLFSLEEGQMESDIDTNWNMFEVAIKHADFPTRESRNEFLKLFPEVLDVRYIGMGNLSRSLFWIRPNHYVSLDENSKEYMKEKFNIQQVDNIKSGEKYLELIKKLKEEFKKRTDVRSFAALSFVADGKTFINKDSKPDKKKTSKTRIFTSGNNSQTKESITKSTRKAKEVEIEHLHVKIQNKLFEDLKKEYGEDNVGTEDNRVDVVLKQGENNYWFYEIKKYESVSYCIREAAGQLLAYKFEAECANWNVEKIIVVGPCEASAEDEEYIEYLRETYKMPISYEQVEIKE